MKLFSIETSLMFLGERKDVCKSCFKDIKQNSFHELFSSQNFVCSKCILEANPKFKYFDINGVKAISIYDYDEHMKTKMYLYKGCEDYEMKDYFIFPYRLELKILFSKYTIIPIPSYEEDDKKRGYNHVIEAFKCLDLPFLKAIIKTENIKQKELNYEQRQDIHKCFIWNKKIEIEGKKILLVDDVCTTGASLKAAINLIKQHNPKKIKILVIAKRELSNEEIREYSLSKKVLK